MAEKPIKTPLPADLPEDWNIGQTVVPDGTTVGLTEQHGYNYLMAAVNRAQQGVNKVNEAFETVSGNRTCRFVVGTSTAGWTAADCDFLCDGTDDQVEIQAAIDALPEREYGKTGSLPGEIVILAGNYHLTGAIIVAEYCALVGSPCGTILYIDKEPGISNGKNAAIYLSAEAVLKNFSVGNNVVPNETNKNNAIIAAEGTNIVENVSIFGLDYSGFVGIYIFKDSGGADGIIIKNCTFQGLNTAILINGRAGDGSTITGNKVPRGSGKTTTVKKFVDVDLSDEVYGSCASELEISCNTAALSDLNLMVSGLSTRIISNSFNKIIVMNPDPVTSGLKRGNIIANNILSGDSKPTTTPAILLGENTCGWFVAGNQVRIPGENEKYWPIVDNGINNDIRFNSDDPGGSTPATVQQATPTVTVNADGTVTASTTQAAGYVAAGTRSATHKLSSADDTNLTPENIKEGVSIFGVEGNLQSGGGTVISASIDPAGSGTVSGAGTYQEGETVTITATPGDGYKFTGWQENGAVVSSDAAYSFTVTENRTFVAAFEVKKTSRLPAGYTEVEYIEILSESSTLSLSPLFIHTRSVFEFHVGASEKPSGNRYLFNTYVTSANAFELYMSKSGAATGIAGNPSTNIISKTFSIFPNTFIFSGDFSPGVTSKRKMYIDSTSATTAWTNSSTSNVLKIGMDTTSRKALTGGRIYSMKSECSSYSTEETNYKYTNWELVPCVHDDGRVGMYDIVNNTPFLASGTDFSAGPAV